MRCPNCGEEITEIKNLENEIASLKLEIKRLRSEKSINADIPSCEAQEESDELFPDAVRTVLKTGQASATMLQRRLNIGYNRSAKIIEQMEQKGYIGPFEGTKPRKILITKDVLDEITSGGE